MSSFLDSLQGQVRSDRNDLERYLLRSPDLVNYDARSELMNKISKLRRSIENLQDWNLRFLKDNHKLRKENEKLQREVQDLYRASVSISQVTTPMPAPVPLNKTVAPIVISKPIATVTPITTITQVKNVQTSLPPTFTTVSPAKPPIPVLSIPPAPIKTAPRTAPPIPPFPMKTQIPSYKAQTKISSIQTAPIKTAPRTAPPVPPFPTKTQISVPKSTPLVVQTTNSPPVTRVALTTPFPPPAPAMLLAPTAPLAPIAPEAPPQAPEAPPAPPPPTTPVIRTAPPKNAAVVKRKILAEPKSPRDDALAQIKKGVKLNKIPVVPNQNVPVTAPTPSSPIRTTPENKAAIERLKFEQEKLNKKENDEDRFESDEDEEEREDKEAKQTIESEYQKIYQTYRKSQSEESVVNANKALSQANINVEELKVKIQKSFNDSDKLKQLKIKLQAAESEVLSAQEVLEKTLSFRPEQLRNSAYKATEELDLYIPSTEQNLIRSKTKLEKLKSNGSTRDKKIAANEVEAYTANLVLSKQLLSSAIDQARQYLVKTRETDTETQNKIGATFIKNKSTDNLKNVEQTIKKAEEILSANPTLKKAGKFISKFIYRRF